MSATPHKSSAKWWKTEKNWNGTFNKNRLPLIEWVAQWSIQWLSGSKLQFYICFSLPHSVVNWCAVPVRRDINLLMIYDCRFWKMFRSVRLFSEFFFHFFHFWLFILCRVCEQINKSFLPLFIFIDVCWTNAIEKVVHTRTGNKNPEFISAKAHNSNYINNYKSETIGRWR